MSEENRCPECGAPLPAHAPQGLCPGCLLKRGIETAPPASEKAGLASGDFTPPTPEQLAAQFPDLEILEFIGRGGMGMVYKARQKHLDRLVALKILLPNIARDPAFAERFTREARAMAMLSHPHIVTVHDFGQTNLPSPSGRGAGGEGSVNLPSPSGRGAGGEGSLYYFIMEFVDGLTLRQLLDAGKLSPPAALAIVPQICEALQYAHDKGVIHRDIKPENILMDRSGQVKIADFGLAKLVGQEAKDFSLTGAGQVMGTPHYMAPEQFEHPQDVDHRTDIYSLGVVFYQMLTGELPIGRFAPPSQRVQVNVRLDEVVLRALEKQPELRYQQASELRTQVEAITATTPTPPSSRPAKSIPTGPPTGAVAEVENGMPRFSRAAIVGAAWAPLFFVTAILALTPVKVEYPTGGSPPGPEWWQWVLRFTLLPLGLLAPFGTTILGAVAMAQIRHSVGRLYGLALALFDTLLFPLLLLDGLIGWLWWFASDLIRQDMVANAAGAPLSPASMTFIANQTQLVLWVTVLTSAVVDFFLIRWAWRAANKPSNGSLPSSSESVASSSKPSTPMPSDVSLEPARLQVQGPAIGLLVTGILNWLVVPAIVLVMVYMSGMPTSSRPGQFSSTPEPLILVALLACLLFSSFVIFAALKMKQLEAYGLAIAASLLAIIISPSNLIGLPIGIWSLVVLSRTDVGAAFARREREKAPRRPATREEKRLGFAALALSVAAIPLALCLGWMLAAIWKTVILSFVLLQVIALVCGIAGRRSVAGRIGICLSVTIMALGATFMALTMRTQLRHDFGGMPSIVALDARAETSPGGNPVEAAAGQATPDDDRLSSLHETSYATSLPPVDVNQKTFGTVIVLDLAPNCFGTRHLKPVDYGLPADATPEQVAAKAEQGDLYLTLSAKAGPAVIAARLVPLRAATLFPLKLPDITPASPNWTYIDRLKGMSRSQITAAGDAFIEAHPSAKDRVASVSEAEKYALVRPDGETFVLSIGELSQDADRSNRQLGISMFPIGRIPWGTKFRVVDTQGKAVAGATATFSITERLQKVDGVATYQTRREGTYQGDDQGCIRLPRLPRDATFRGEVAAPGFLPREDINGARDNVGRYYPPCNGTVQLRRPGVIEGRVLGPNGKPLVHAPLSLTTSVEYPNSSSLTGNHLRAITNEQGRFRIEGVPPGNHFLYYPWDGPTQGEVDSGRWRAFGTKKDARLVVPHPLAGYGLVKPITVDEAATVRDVVLDFSRSTSAVEGKVLDAAGKPVSGASVRLLWPRGDGANWMSLGLPDAVTDAAGHYRIDHLPPESFQLQAIPPGMKVVPEKSPPVQVELAAEQVLRQDLRITP